MAVAREDPYPAHAFLVEIDGVLDGDEIAAGFAEVSGLGVEIDVIEYRTGNERQKAPRKLSGVARYSNLVLKRGITGDLALWEWIKRAVDGEPLRANGVITLLNEDREPVLRWRFRRGWPCRYSGPGLDADGSSVAIEELEICHEGLAIE